MLVLIVVAVSSLAQAAPARRAAWRPPEQEWQEGKGWGRGKLGLCSVEWVWAKGTNKIDAQAIMRAWFARSAATQKACVLRGVPIVARRPVKADSMEIFVPPANANQVLGSGEIQGDLRRGAEWLAKAFDTEVVVMVGDPDKPGDPTAYVLKFKGEPR